MSLLTNFPYLNHQLAPSCAMPVLLVVNSQATFQLTRQIMCALRDCNNHAQGSVVRFFYHYRCRQLGKPLPIQQPSLQSGSRDVACGRLCMAKTCTHEVDTSRKHVDFGLPHWSRKTIWGCWQPALAWLKNGDVRRWNIVWVMMMMARRLVQLMRQHIDKGQTDD